MDVVHHLRQKKNLQATLPPLTLESDNEERMKLIEAQEIRDWEFREKQLKE